MRNTTVRTAIFGAAAVIASVIGVVGPAQAGVPSYPLNSSNGCMSVIGAAWKIGSNDSRALHLDLDFTEGGMAEASKVTFQVSLTSFEGGETLITHTSAQSASMFNGRGDWEGDFSITPGESISVSVKEIELDQTGWNCWGKAVFASTGEE